MIFHICQNSSINIVFHYKETSIKGHSRVELPINSLFMDTILWRTDNMSLNVCDNLILWPEVIQFADYFVYLFLPSVCLAPGHFLRRRSSICDGPAHTAGNPTRGVDPNTDQNQLFISTTEFLYMAKYSLVSAFNKWTLLSMLSRLGNLSNLAHSLVCLSLTCPTLPSRCLLTFGLEMSSRHFIVCLRWLCYPYPVPGNAIFPTQKSEWQREHDTHIYTNRNFPSAGLLAKRSK